MGVIPVYKITLKHINWNRQSRNLNLACGSGSSNNSCNHWLAESHTCLLYINQWESKWKICIFDKILKFVFSCFQGRFFSDWHLLMLTKMAFCSLELVYVFFSLSKSASLKIRRYFVQIKKKELRSLLL